MRSMTAYARVQRRKNSQVVQLTLRSLNFKYLDIAIHNLPAENVFLEEKIKKEIKKKVSRGKVEVYVFLSRPQDTRIYIDNKAVSRYLSQIKMISKKYKLSQDINISRILALPQVVCFEQKYNFEQSLIQPVLKEALDKLVRFKEKEGKAIKREMLSNLRRLNANVKKIKQNKPHVSEDENGREDIDEELSLISFYAKKLEEKITNKRSISKGKSIDFFTQEILRELNAASSKTHQKKAAVLIVESKNYLERIREQAQNIE